MTSKDDKPVLLRCWKNGQLRAFGATSCSVHECSQAFGEQLCSSKYGSYVNVSLTKMSDGTTIIERPKDESGIATHDNNLNGQQGEDGCDEVAVPKYFGKPVALGHPVTCPALELGNRGIDIRAKKGHTSLAVCVIVRNHKNEVLLTRRGAHMRTFPLAWVLPGGGVDPGEDLAECGRREVFEETGLRVSPETMEIVGMWESCYPTTAERCLEVEQLQGHTLVVWLSAILASEEQDINIEEDEVDQMIWIKDDILKTVVNGSEKEFVLQGINAKKTHISVESAQLHGVYPNLVKEGIARGHMFVLHQLYLSNEMTEDPLSSAK